MRITIVKQNTDEFFLSCIDEFYSSNLVNTEYEFSEKRFYKVTINSIVVTLFKRFKFPFFKLYSGSSKKRYFTMQMGPSFYLCIPKFLLFKNNILYIYDCWPRYHKWFIKLLYLFNIKDCFVSSLQVYNKLIAIDKRCNYHWLSEGINSKDYYYSEKTIDVLEFGRLYDLLHEKLKYILVDYKHVYPIKEKLLFQTHKDFIDGLAKSKICICIPSDITHPSRAEGISTMTQRYLQAMSAKCLILGIKPYDLEPLFGYNPIIEIDLDNLSNQIIDILSNFDRYTELIEKNYVEVRENHQWENRWKFILQNIQL